jgi:hypothetical protein
MAFDKAQPYSRFNTPGGAAGLRTFNISDVDLENERSKG